MGCQCGKKLDEEESNEVQKNMFEKNEEKSEEDSKLKSHIEEQKLKYSNYPQKMFELINSIRTDPKNYCDIISDNIQNIQEQPDKEDPNKTKLIFKKKVKVALTRGLPAFEEAIEILKTIKPLPPLEFKQDICIPLPENDIEFKDTKYLREQVKIIRENNEIDVFYKDLIKVPEVSALLMIVDDNGKNSGKKRAALLNKDFHYIGISSKFVGKNFIAYFSFSKK